MKVKINDKIKVDYEGRFENNEVFDSSNKNGQNIPLEFEVGIGQVVKGFDDAVLGMEKGEEKEINIKPEEAYGDYNEELKKDIPREALPKDQEPKEGMILVLNTPDGRQFPAKIIKVEKEKVVIDLNHPLAGKNLKFKIKILDIESSDKKG